MSNEGSDGSLERVLLEESDKAKENEDHMEEMEEDL